MAAQNRAVMFCAEDGGTGVWRLTTQGKRQFVVSAAVVTLALRAGIALTAEALVAVLEMDEDERVETCKPYGETIRTRPKKILKITAATSTITGRTWNKEYLVLR